jgi:hypothetical protein
MLALLCTFSSVYAAKENKPIEIDPSISAFDSTLSLNTTGTFYIKAVGDTSVYRSAKGYVGETRVGRNKKAPIFCNPIPSIALKQSLQTLLTTENAIATSAESADCLIEITIIDFSITEKSKKLTQTMTAEIVLLVKLTKIKDGNTFKQFSVKTQNSYSTLDTSKHATTVLKGALLDALEEIINNLND